LLAPAGLPPDVHKRLADAYQAIARSPALRSRIEALGYEAVVDTPGQFATAMRDELSTLRASLANESKALQR
jgi:tripartite-type tricarboxylate transporter receptor subunit TctC